MINATNQNTPSFSSRIKFVSPETFSKEIKGVTSFIDSLDWTKTSIVQDSQDVFTKNVRSCSGGGIVNNGKVNSFFHLQDTNNNISEIPIIEKLLNTDGTNAILLGQKDLYRIKKKWNHSLRTLVPTKIEKTESETLFNKLKSFLDDKLPLSYFHGHSEDWESHMFYKGSKDTWYVCTKDINYNQLYVRNQDDLNKVFKEWQISNADSLAFEN